ncbi:hypothetical protein, partial [Actinomadura sp. 7K507]|uniref:hypothetical protein n=1 Tax=Actinomadura sp. 7K507 TaxID=2530365 RepID=UPI001A9D47F7
SGDRADGEEPEPRPRHPFPPGDRPRLPDIPAITVQSPPPRTPGDRSDDTRRHLDDLRKRAQEELNRHRNNRHRD